MKMPFGPHRDELVADLTDAYLYQLIERRLWPDLAAAVEAELERRAMLRRALKKAA